MACSLQYSMPRGRGKPNSPCAVLIEWSAPFTPPTTHGATGGGWGGMPRNLSLPLEPKIRDLLINSGQERGKIYCLKNLFSIVLGGFLSEEMALFCYKTLAILFHVLAKIPVFSYKNFVCFCPPHYPPLPFN